MGIVVSRGRVIWFLVVVGAVIGLSVTVFRRSQTSVEVERLTSPEATAAERGEALAEIARGGGESALRRLRSIQRDLADTLAQKSRDDVVDFQHLNYDDMIRLIADRRGSESRQRLWAALGEINAKILELEGGPIADLASDPVTVPSPLAPTSPADPSPQPEDDAARGVGPVTAPEAAPAAGDGLRPESQPE